MTFAERASNSKFYLFKYGGDLSRIREALGFRCVLMVIIDCLIQDLPFLDVVRWQEIVVFIGRGRGMKESKHVLVQLG